jgi:hypothetical protein
MIDHRGGPGPDRLQTADEPGVVKNFIIYSSIEAPPEVTQNRDKVVGWFNVGENPPGKTGIEVVVTANDPRHYIPAGGIDNGVILFYGDSRLNFTYGRSVYEDINPLLNPGRIELKQGPIFYDFHLASLIQREGSSFTGFI